MRLIGSIYQCILLVTCFNIFISCDKKAFLDEKPDDKLIVPSTLADFRLILDESATMNGFGVGLTPGLGEAASDDYYVNEYLYNTELSKTSIYEQIYTWKDGIFLYPDKKPEDWGFPYRCILNSNIVLEGLSKIAPKEQEKTEYNNLKGCALFHRAYMFFLLAQVFAPPYDESTSSVDWGIPIRLSPDVSQGATREKLNLVYDRILTDLNSSIELLPDNQLYNSRPSKCAAYGLLARIYLSMRDYDNALINANLCLKIKSDLLDYNEINNGNFFTFNRNNKEIIYYSLMSYQYLDVSYFYYARIDSTLFESYSEHDLRKALFYMPASIFGVPNDNGFLFRGSYDGSDRNFSGIATDEIFLIRSECNARKGSLPLAMADLNLLIQKRWNTNYPFTPYSPIDQQEALSIILTERRKELVMRGLRWIDLRRLNKEGRNIILKRKLNGVNYQLAPNSLSYTFLIPQEVISFNPGMPQNPR